MRTLLLLSSAALAHCEVYVNLNNVDGVAPGKDVEGVNKYLGKVKSMEGCMSVGESYGGVTYFNSSYGVNEDFQEMCYGVNTSLNWNPTPQQGVSSSWDHQAIKTPCETSDDCSRNGDCDNGFCVCFPQWTGARCSVLNLKPSASEGLGLRRQETSSWGGSVLYDETDGLYHMWAAEMANSCGIRVWETNSQVRHATSPDPLTVPFTPKEVVFGVFATEPTVVRVPKTGQFVIYFTAMFAPNVPCTNHTCNSCSMGTSINDGTCPNDQQCNSSAPHLPLSSYMSYANSSSGPWSQPEVLPAPFSGDTNFAPYIFEDGSLVALGRPPYVWKSSNWKDVSKYSYSTIPNNTLVGEDPFVYQTGDGTLHALLHGRGWRGPYGHHYWSNDRGSTWKGDNNIHTYDSKITYKSAPPAALSRRERPHLVFSKDNKTLPIALTTAATPVWPCDSPNDCPTDYCFTSLQELNM